MIDLRLLGSLSHLSIGERLELVNSSKRIERIERGYIERFNDLINQYDEKTFHSLWAHGRINTEEIDFLPLVLEQSFRTMMAAIKDGLNSGTEVRLAHRFASIPGVRIPRSLAELKDLYDLWRSGRKVPNRQKIIAARIKRAYLKRVQSVWARHSEAFRQGATFNLNEVREVLRTDGDMAKARVETIVRTESTNYWNKGRRVLYDRSPDVTHYLFVALRDKATTRWCKTRQGLVYAKNDPLLKKETPAIHYGCRSEILPLSTLNPRHLNLINDKTRARRNNRCAPLPPGWGK
jgi:SPP1 gp7 family putative phage head morphogenesis protein